jgi:hypothetical protein
MNLRPLSTWLLFVVLAGCPADEPVESALPDPAEDCGNGVDDDADLLADCADDDCVCAESDCDDGDDDDGDGDVDCEDDDCE